MIKHNMEAGEAINRVMFDLRAAMEHALDKNGPMPIIDLVRCAAITVEEACEALSEAMKLTSARGTASHQGASGTIEAMFHELMQTAGTAILTASELKRIMKEREVQHRHV